MSDAKAVITGVIATLASIYKTARTAYSSLKFGFGDAMLTLREHGYSWKDAGDRLREAFPFAEAEVGVKLTDAWLRASAEDSATFRKDGGYASRDGKHRVSRGDLESLKLPKKLADQVSEAVAYSEGEARIKGTPVLRVMDLASAARQVADARGKGPEAEAKAIKSAHEALVTRLAEVEEGYIAATVGDKRAVLAAQVSAAKLAVAKAEASLAKARAKLGELQGELAKLDAERSQKDDSATATVEQPTPPRRRLPKRSAGVAAGAAN